MLISDNLPRRRGLPPTPGRAAKRFDWTPGGRGWEAEAWELGAGSWELAAGRQKRSACLTTGLPGYGQGCSPRIVRLEHQKLAKKCILLREVFARALIFGAEGLIFEGFQ